MAKKQKGRSNENKKERSVSDQKIDNTTEQGINRDNSTNKEQVKEAVRDYSVRPLNTIFVF